jgi:two-component system cell cycle sensor histidine kinase/response regulator CckA
MNCFEAPVDVLLVEDDMLVLETLGEALRLAGLVAERHMNAESALAALGTVPPKAMITDINLGSGMDGVTLGRVVRARFADLPVIYISGRYGELRGLSPQERFLLKPFPPAVLVRTLRDLNVATSRDLAFRAV